MSILVPKTKLQLRKLTFQQQQISKKFHIIYTTNDMLMKNNLTVGLGKSINAY